MTGGADKTRGALFSCFDLEARIPARQPLCKIRWVMSKAQAGLDAECEALYIKFGHPSITPEWPIRVYLIQIRFLVCSERQLWSRCSMTCRTGWSWILGPKTQRGFRPASDDWQSGRVIVAILA
ncbi:hypothetical protein ACDP63_10235 [Paracoccus sp. P2]|nr:hypothetical protein BDE18_2119 [Paracoccus pantotrophus]SFN69379.1 hypothetical protein SAMN04244567_00008 [Paracoccus pantotrophus]